MNYLFTSESVSEGHPDKVADQISDAILDQLLAYDPQSKVGCETLVTTGQVIIAGEVKSRAYVDLHDIVRNVIRRIGYNRSELKFDADGCGLLSALHEQSVDINRGVEREAEELQGAGDQGMMFGYAVNETANRMPLTLELAHLILMELSAIRNEGKQMTYLRPDSKSQVTVEYDGETRRPVKIHTIVVSTQHDEFADDDEVMRSTIEADVRNVLMPRVLAKLTPEVAALYNPDDVILHVNPTGKFVIGGPHGDAGLTGRKIIVDTYGGRGAHGGGAFSGKDPSKVDRSAAYAARHIARNLVAAGVADEVLVQVAYAIGVAEPVSLYVNTYGTARVAMSDAEISQKVKQLFDMRPHAIEQRFGLRKPIYSETATYGHFGREPRRITKRFHSPYEKEERLIDVELFAWEKEDMVSEIKNAFNL